MGLQAMDRMEFSDGVSFNMDGPLRVERRRDGYYVVGQGMLCAVDSAIDGYKWIREMKEQEAEHAAKRVTK